MEGRTGKSFRALGEPATPSREVGTLAQPSSKESLFLGSSSGVYFVNTVRNAFAVSNLGCPAPEQTVGGDEYFDDATERPEIRLSVGPHRSIRLSAFTDLGPFPPFEQAQLYCTEYFKTWHPLFPFLSGQAVLDEFRSIYQRGDILKRDGQIVVDREQLCNLFMIKNVLLVGASLSAGREQQDFPSGLNILSIVSALASRHDILTIQAVLAAEVYCLSLLAFRTASTISGILGKMLLHAGFHRCPHRYNLPQEQRDLRKRIFWSYYILDSYLCMALGLPVTIPDSEIDVCISGRKELHTLNASLPMSVTPDSQGTSLLTEHTQPSQSSSDARLQALASLAESGQLIRRMLDIFHRSIHVRRTDPRDVLYLRSDVEKWFNELPYTESESEHGDIQHFPFFRMIYEQIVISVYRPSLSLPRYLPEFQHGLQITIRAAKSIIVTLEKDEVFFWPGYVCAIWMAGLVLAFASQIGLYNVTQAASEVQRCLAILSRMGGRWRKVQHCYKALSILHDRIRQPDRDLSVVFDEMQGSRVKRSRQHETSADLEPGDTIDSDGAGNHVQELNLQDSIPESMISGQDFVTAQSLDLDMDDFFKDLSWHDLFYGNAFEEDGFSLDG